MTILAALSLAAATITVHDGDSIREGIERIRLVGIDAPELPRSPSCRPGRKGWCDYARGYQARDALRAFLASGPVKIDRCGVDPYGRTLARVTVNGVDAGRYLLERGLARRWIGRTGCER